MSAISCHDIMPTLMYMARTNTVWKVDDYKLATWLIVSEHNNQVWKFRLLSVPLMKRSEHITWLCLCASTIHVIYAN